MKVTFFLTSLFFLRCYCPTRALGRLIVEVSHHTQLERHKDPVGLLWTGDQIVIEAATYTTDEPPCPQRDSKLQSQQPRGCRPAPQTARPADRLLKTQTATYIASTIIHFGSVFLMKTVQLGPQAASLLRFLITYNQRDTRTRQDSSGRVIRSSQRPLPTQQTNLHALSGIRNCSLSNQEAADLRLRPDGHRIVC